LKGSAGMLPALSGILPDSLKFGLERNCELLRCDV
jgi:hypothetical protein